MTLFSNHANKRNNPYVTKLNNNQYILHKESKEIPTLRIAIVVVVINFANYVPNNKKDIIIIVQNVNQRN